MNLESLVKTAAFRSYWIQRNTSAVGRYWAGLADVKRAAGSITETRTFLGAQRSPDSAANSSEVANLVALVPPDAGMYKAAASEDAGDVASTILQKLIAPQVQRQRDWRYAPQAVSADVRAGSEADLGHAYRRAAAAP